MYFMTVDRAEIGMVSLLIPPMVGRYLASNKLFLYPKFKQYQTQETL